jgi:hypothetical protein
MACAVNAKMGMPLVTGSALSRRVASHLFVPQERLDHPDIPAALEKMGGEAVAQCM